MAVERALPRRTLDNARFWESCQERAMELQRCDACARFWYYPSPMCPHCASMEFTWTPVSGLGSVHTFSWIYRPAPGFEHCTPYAYGLVELDEGPFLATNFVRVDVERLRVGLPVRVCYRSVTPEVTLALFQPAPGA